MALFIGSARDVPEKYERAAAATREMADIFRELARRAAQRRSAISDRARGPRRRRRALVGGRAGRDVHALALRRPRDHHASPRERLRALLAFPGELEKLRADPSLAPAAVEELLRYDGPIGAQVRIVQEPNTLHGKALRRGERVFLLMNAANRDPRAYPEPDRLDLRRNGVPHLTFGFGAHICLGFRSPGRQIACLRVLALAAACRSRPSRVDGFDGPARNESDAAAGARRSAEPDHLPKRLWWVLASLTLAWGFNWTAMKVAAQVPPWTFRSLCLGWRGGALRRPARRRSSASFFPTGQWRRLWMLALLNITSWNMLIAFGVGMIPSGRAAILAYTMPVWALPLSVWLLGERISRASSPASRSALAGSRCCSRRASPAWAARRSARCSCSARIRHGRSARCCRSVFPCASRSVFTPLDHAARRSTHLRWRTDLRRLGRSSNVGVAAWLGTAYNVLIAFAFAHWADQDRHLGAGERVSISMHPVVG